MINWCLYNAETDGDWDAQLQRLPGANFFQTSGWALVKSATGWHVLKLVVKDSDCIVSMALILFRRQPLSGAIVWIPGGIVGEPAVWATSFKSALKRELRLTWVYIRFNALGLENQEHSATVLKEAGWRKPRVSLGSGLSLLYTLSDDDVGRLAALSTNWRHNLKRSRKYGLRFERWQAPDAAIIQKIYHSMETYKALPTQFTKDELEAMLRFLGNQLVIYKCENTLGEIIAIRACAVFNGQAFDLLAAAGPSARKVYASYGLLWALLSDCHRSQVAYYDLGGIEPSLNKGVYDFKRGLGSKLVVYLGEWECASPRFLKYIVNLTLFFRKRKIR
jgi:lipid II:glycine glycyltransferase (peptidoglycan interpeptide bridge formation enzyme)